MRFNAQRNSSKQEMGNHVMSWDVDKLRRPYSHLAQD